MRLALCTVIVGLLAQAGWAQGSEAEARQFIQTYVEAHNSHALDEVMALYDEDAVFYLNSGREPVHGRDAIRGLELFDTVAKSTIYPQAMVFTGQDGVWRVAIGSALEHSAIFAAVGVSIVTTEPMEDAFVLRGDRIIEIHQPELAPACRRAILSGFQGVAEWLGQTKQPQYAGLLREGRIHLTPETIPAVVDAIDAWRDETGWTPQRSDVSACAGFRVD